MFNLCEGREVAAHPSLKETTVVHGYPTPPHKHTQQYLQVLCEIIVWTFTNHQSVQVAIWTVLKQTYFLMVKSFSITQVIRHHDQSVTCIKGGSGSYKYILIVCFKLPSSFSWPPKFLGTLLPCTGPSSCCPLRSGRGFHFLYTYIFSECN
jgi:hypothetical protein